MLGASTVLKNNSQNASYDENFDFNPDNYVEEDSTLIHPRTPSPPPRRMIRKTAFADFNRHAESDSMPSSINATPEKVKAVAGLLKQFDDEQPWELSEGKEYNFFKRKVLILPVILISIKKAPHFQHHIVSHRQSPQN